VPQVLIEFAEVSRSLATFISLWTGSGEPTRWTGPAHCLVEPLHTKSDLVEPLHTRVTRRATNRFTADYSNFS
jgi:hypothetical protein